MRQNAFSMYGKPVLISMAIGILTGMLLLCVMSFVLTKTDVAPTTIPMFGMVSVLVVSFVSGFAAARQTGAKGLAMGAVTGVGLFVIVFLLCLLFSGEEITPMAFLKLTIVVVSAAIGGIFGVNRRKKVPKIKQIKR